MLWVASTIDYLELPLVVTDTAIEMAVKVGLNERTVRKAKYLDKVNSKKFGLIKIRKIKNR